MLKGPCRGTDPSVVGNRAALRTEVLIPVLFFGSRVEGTGVICDVSATGALILQPTAPVPDSQKITLELGTPSDLESLRVAARVVRQVTDGFAVDFFFDGAGERSLVLGLLDLLTSQRETEADSASLRKQEPEKPPPAAPKSELREPTLQGFKAVIRGAHSCGADLRERASVRQPLADGTVWEGKVLVFDLIGHPTALTCYAWAVDHEVTTVLHQGPVDSPHAAVRVSREPAATTD